MDIGMYKGNSNTDKERAAKAEERPKLEKIVTGEVKMKKKSGFGTFLSKFITDDPANIKTRIVEDVIIPTVKDTLFDILRTIFNIGPRGGKSTTNVYKASYRSYYDSPKYRDNEPQRVSSTLNYDNIVIYDRGEAELVLDRLREVIEVYKVARVADLNDIVGISGEFTDNNYGWTNLRNAEVVPVRGGGYALKLPRALPID
jgi:hypothetical protein